MLWGLTQIRSLLFLNPIHSKAEVLNLEDNIKNHGCKLCRNSTPLDFEITMAYQPIVDIQTRRVYAYEALVRGKDGSGAGAVLSRVTDDNRYRFDQTCRVKAIEIAARLGLDTRLSINFLPNAVYDPKTCIRATLAEAARHGFPIEQIMFEVTESEPVRDPVHLQGIFNEYRNQGFITAIDDFGAGFAGLNLLSQFRPEIIKLDMGLCQGIADDKVKRAIAEGIISTATSLEIKVIAEGIERKEDLETLAGMGVNLFQGYLLARPEVEALPVPDYSVLAG